MELREEWNAFFGGKGFKPTEWEDATIRAAAASRSNLSLDEDDNWDTGNALCELGSLPEFVDHVKNDVVSDSSDCHRKYIQFGAHDVYKGKLSAAATETLHSLGLPFDTEVKEYSTVGYGATHVWDACCRMLLPRRGDMIIIPIPSYSLFITKIVLAKGKPVYISLSADAKLTADELDAGIRRNNDTALQLWRRQLPNKLPSFALEVESLLGIAVATEEISRIVGEIQTVLDQGATQSSEFDGKLRTLLVDSLFHMNTSQIDDFNHSRLLAEFLPPRVVGLFFINPSIPGRYYTHRDIEQLAPVLARHGVVPIEDWAHVLMPLNVEVLKSVGRFAAHPATSDLAITLVGMSKPFGLANHRISVAMGRNPKRMLSLDQLIKASVAQVSSVLSDAALAAFSDPDGIRNHVVRCINDPVAGYARKLSMAYQCFLGNENHKAFDEAFVRQIVKSDDEDEMIRRFVTTGLSPWFRIACIPEGGMFLIVDCTKAMECLRKAKFVMDSSFDFSIFLSFACRIRTIPEELMVDWANNLPPGKLLRVTYIIRQESFIGAAYELFKHLSAAETLQLQ